MLHVHRSDRADGLVAGLGDLLTAPLPDPFAAEVVAVPTRGMERWLGQVLSARLGARAAGAGDGVCANVQFPAPRALLGDAIAAACGVDPERDPWRPERTVWSLLELVDAHLDEPWLAPLRSHLGDPGDAVRRARRFAVVRHLAGLFDRYALHRPAMVGAWLEGRSVDGEGAPLPPGHLWQAELWRALRDAIGAPGPVERLADACARLRADAGAVALPERVALFGLTRLPAGDLQVLRALAVQRDVHIYVLHPSPALWQAVTAIDASEVTLRAADPSAALVRHRLLASWGRDARELQVVLAAAEERAEHEHPVEHAAGTLLARLQAAIRADSAPPGPPLPGAADARAVLDPDDRSVQVHACHGRSRQVEVVRDVVLHELAADPSLEPRDIIVMCPDIEVFAPLIGAAFGAGEPPVEDDDEDGDEDTGAPAAGPRGRPAELRVRLADRSLRQTNPVLGVVAGLLELPARRLTASEVLDLADREPVRRRFGFDDDDLARLQDWVADSGIRWGLDGPHRAPYKLAALVDGTWAAGLDRVLAGVAMTEDGQRLVGGVLPLDDVDSGAIDLAGRLAELVARLRTTVIALGRTQPLADWVGAIGTAADALCATGPFEGWQRAQLQRLLDDALDAAGDRATVLAPAEVRALLADRLAGRPTRANFRTGHLTICTLVPMRSVPHRVVCLLGLDDGTFPRKAPLDGDDLMLASAHVGDRDPRSEDRQLLLDALLAARDRFVVTYAGRDERTNAEKPPAVPVGELLDAVAATVRCADGAPARAAVVTRHPLQPFAPRNFEAGQLLAGRPWSFDATALAGARVLGTNRPPPPPFLPAGPLPGPDGTLLALEDLVAFCQRPVRAFLRQRLGISLGRAEDEIADGLAVELDGLGAWQVGDRLLQRCLSGVALDAAIAAERARGQLPPGRLGEPALAGVRPAVEAITARVDAIVPAGAEAGSLDVRVGLADGRLLSGTVAGVRGDVLVLATYSKVKPAQRMATWVRWLAVTATHPERELRAVVAGRSSDRWADVGLCRFEPFAGDAAERRERALAELEVLADLHRRGLREPLPVACETSAAYAAAARAGGDLAAAGRRAWESGFGRPREDREPEHELVFGGVLGFDELYRPAARADEAGAGWDAGEASRFGRYARRLWDGLLAHERREDL